jgi:hypothetical protein
MLISVRYDKDGGNSLLYLRLKNSTNQYFNFTLSTWVNDGSISDCKVFLYEYPDGDDNESLYMSSVPISTRDS